MSKLRCHKCRSGPIIVSKYANEEVVRHCASCGYTWSPRKPKTKSKP